MLSFPIFLFWVSWLIIFAGSLDLPNFLILFIDDMGYGDLQVYGHPTIKTPNINRLAKEGILFTQWYSAHAICTPSRAGIMTGRLPVRFGLCGSDPGGSQSVFACGAEYGLPSNETTIATALKSKNYNTAMVGKWHLGQRKQYLPTAHGFDQYLGVPYSCDMGFAYHNRTPMADQEGHYYGCNPLALLDGDEIIEQPTELATLSGRYLDYAIEFLRNQTKQSKPFFFYYAFNHVHTPQFASKKDIGKSRRGIFGDSVEEMDKCVGAVMDVLRETKLAENTLVILTSDNGAPDAHQHNYPGHRLSPYAGSNGLFLGTKTSTWEGGLREPGIIWGSMVAKPGQRVFDQASTLDIYATVMDFAGISIPKDKVMDSISLRPVIEGHPSNRTTQFFYQGCILYAVRHGPWKMHYHTTPPQEVDAHANPKPYGVQNPPLLYQIENDPGESYPIKKGHNDIRSEFEAIVKAHKEELGTRPPAVLGFNDPKYLLCCDNTTKPPCTCTPPLANFCGDDCEL